MPGESLARIGDQEMILLAASGILVDIYQMIWEEMPTDNWMTDSLPAGVFGTSRTTAPRIAVENGTKRVQMEEEFRPARIDTMTTMTSHEKLLIASATKPGLEEDKSTGPERKGNAENIVTELFHVMEGILENHPGVRFLAERGLSGQAQVVASAPLAAVNSWCVERMGKRETEDFQPLQKGLPAARIVAANTGESVMPLQLEPIAVMMSPLRLTQ